MALWAYHARNVRDRQVFGERMCEEPKRNDSMIPPGQLTDTATLHSGQPDARELRLHNEMSGFFVVYSLNEEIFMLFWSGEYVPFSFQYWPFFTNIKKIE